MLFRILIFLLHFCSFFSFGILHRNNQKRTFFTIIKGTVTFFLASFHVLSILPTLVKFKYPFIIPHSILYAILIINFCMIFFKFEKIKKLTTLKVIKTGRVSTIAFIYLWLIIIIITYVLTLTVFIIGIFESRDLYKFSRNLNATFIYVFKVILCICFLLNLQLSTVILPLMYTLLCSCIKQVFKQMNRLLILKIIINYDQILCRYMFLKNIVKDMDDTFSFFMFTNTIFNAAHMYFTLITQKRRKCFPYS